MRALHALILFCLVTPVASASVWSSTRTWSPAWERSYSEWVQNHWSADFFARRRLPNGQANPYQGLRTDCADTVYSMRAVFAYESGLPFVINDPTGSGKFISNDMNRFDGITGPSERFRAFLQFLYGTVSTQSMPMDTYPVALRRGSVRPGVVLKTVQSNHHSWTVKAILSVGVPWLIFNSTVGRSSGSMLQERKSWPNPGWVFQGDQTPRGNAGFRDWRPAEYLKRPVWETPGYSEEQYHIPLNKWVSVATSRLATQNESDSARLERLAQTACADLAQRVSAVQEGIQALRQLKTTCMDQDAYDTYSTPSRDQRFFDDLVALRRDFRAVVASGRIDRLSRVLVRQLSKVFPQIELRARDEAARMQEQPLDANSLCPLTYAQGHRLDLAEAKRRLFAGLMSNNPMDELSYRWGDRQGPSQRARGCPTWDMWEPNLDQAD